MEVLTRRLPIGRSPKTPAAALRRRFRKVTAMLGVFRKLSSSRQMTVLRQRQLVADFFRLIGAQLGEPTRSRSRPEVLPPTIPLEDLGLSTRLRQTLQGLLAGEAEKQIAYRLNLSPHTVHVYVKGLYRHFGVSSRGELLARFVRPSPPEN